MSMTTNPEYVDVEDIVRLTNHGKETWRAGWNSKKYTCPPGKSIFVPFHVVINEFGDPRSATLAQRALTTSGAMDFIPSRESEIARLCQLYGAYDDIARLKEVVPAISLEDQNGNEIYGVIHDIEGEKTLPATPTPGLSEKDFYMAKIREFEAKFRALESGQDVSHGQPVDDQNDDDEGDGSSGPMIPEGTKPDDPNDFSTAPI